MIYGIIILNIKKENYTWQIINPEVLREKDIQQWMISCVAHRNLLEEFIGMYYRTDIEGFPSEHGMLHPIATAMKESRKIKVIYRRYGFPKPNTFIVEPYFVKTYKHRFYVLCKFDSGDYYTLSFDRMEFVTVLDEKFNFPDNLFAQEFFEDSFGVMMPHKGDCVEDIIIRAKGDAKYFLGDVPIHKSQTLIKEDKEYADFKIHVRPTNDFYGAVLQQGTRLEIISPPKVRDKITEVIRHMLTQYTNV